MEEFPEWRKMPRDARDALRGSEDYLTARTVGMFRFLSTSALSELFRRLGIDLGVGRPRVALWPDAGICEPDASIETQEALVFVEAKFLGSQLGFYPSQLGREWLALTARPRPHRRVLWLLTNDAIMPKVPALKMRADGELECVPQQVTVAEQICQYCRLTGTAELAPSVVESSLRWSSWSAVSAICEVLLSLVEADSVDSAALAEMRGALNKFGCVPFSEWSYELPSVCELSAPIWLVPARQAKPLWAFSYQELTALSVSPWGIRHE